MKVLNQPGNNAEGSDGKRTPGGDGKFHKKNAKGSFKPQGGKRFKKN